MRKTLLAAAAARVGFLPRPTLLTFTVAGFVATTAIAQEAPPTAASQDEVAALEEIVVYSSTKTETKLTEIPQSVSVITADQMQKYGAQGLDEAVRFAPGVVGGSYGFDARTDWILIRGYDPARYLDGLTLPNGSFTQASRIEPYGLERVEVLKGPSSAMYGQQPPGGMLNMTSKRPSLNAQNEIVATVGSFDQLQGAVDLGGGLTDSGSMLWRFVALKRDSDTPVDMAEDNRELLAPSFTWKPTDSTSLTVLARRQKTDSKGVAGFLPAEGTLLPNPNGKISPSLYTGEPDYDNYDKVDKSIGYEFAQGLGDGWTFRQNLRFQSVDLEHNLIGTFGLADDKRTLIRYFFPVAEASRVFAIDNQVGGTLTSGAVQHKLLAGIDYLRSRNDYKSAFAFGAPSLDAFNPVYGTPFTPPDYTSHQFNVLDQTGAYVQDQAQLGSWGFIGSLRHDWVTNDLDDRMADTSTSQKDREFSGRAGVNYMFENGLTPYLAYSHSFKSTTGGGVLFSGGTLKPLYGDQVEGGVKLQTRSTLLTAAAYTLTQKNSITPDPDHPTYSVQQGETRTRGIELEARHHITTSLSAGATYAYTDAKVTEANDNLKGNRVALVPKHSATASVDYDFVEGVLEGFGIGAAGRYVGRHYGDASNAINTASYTLVDANAHYDLPVGSNGQSLHFQVTAANLFDREYISACQASYWCFYGYPRVVTGSVSYRW